MSLTPMELIKVQLETCINNFV